jgi:hypothetical protein
MDILVPSIQFSEFRRINRKPPTLAELETILSSRPDIIPYFDQWIEVGGRLVPATVLANNDWQLPIQPVNLVATACWHYFAKLKGTNLQSVITGPVVIFTGDPEFMDLVAVN